MKTLVYLLAISMLCCVGQNLSQQPNFRLAESKIASLEKLETERNEDMYLNRIFYITQMEKKIISDDDFESWKKQAKEKITKLKHEEISEKEVYDWILKNS